MKLGEKIKELRKRHRMTQAELAKKLNVAPTAVSAWERNENRPLMDKITILAEMFDVPISYFFSVDDFDNNPSVLEYIPIVGAVSCGNGTIAYEEIEGYEPTPKNWIRGGKYFYLRAKGDSMINARIQDGDLLLIRQQNDVESGEIAAVLIDDEAVLKRVFKENGQVILQSENPKYPPIIVTPEKDIRIIGKLKKVILNF